MNEITIFPHLSLPQQALVFDLEALSTCLQTIPDQRDRRGRHYPLASLLMVGLLANLAGQESSRAMAHWAKLRTQELSQIFELKRERMQRKWNKVSGSFFSPPPQEHSPNEVASSWLSMAKPYREPSRWEKRGASTCWRPICPSRA